MDLVGCGSDDHGGDQFLNGDELALWLDDPSPDAPRPKEGHKRGMASSILMAAMLGLVDALGWERPKDQTVEVADAPIGNDGLVLDYRHLEPLE